MTGQQSSMFIGSMSINLYLHFSNCMCTSLFHLSTIFYVIPFIIHIY